MKSETVHGSCFLKSFRKNLFVVFLTAAIVLLIGSFYVNYCELNWKRKWMKLAGELASAREQITCYDIKRSYEGRGYETVDLKNLITRFQANVHDKVNNLIYEGSSDGYDFITHHVSAATYRMKVPENRSLSVDRFPFQKDGAEEVRLRIVCLGLNESTGILEPIICPAR